MNDIIDVIVFYIPISFTFEILLSPSEDKYLWDKAPFQDHHSGLARRPDLPSIWMKYRYCSSCSKPFSVFATIPSCYGHNVLIMFSYSRITRSFNVKSAYTHKKECILLKIRQAQTKSIHIFPVRSPRPRSHYETGTGRSWFSSKSSITEIASVQDEPGI